MIIKKIHHSETLEIRHQVLWPNKAKDFCKVEGDEQANHYGLFLGGKLMGVASVFIHEAYSQLRKFAIVQSQQSKGYGKLMLAEIISIEKSQDCRVFCCDARESAIGFYEQFSMKKQGDRFYKSEVPYFKMSLHLGEK